MTHTVTCGLSLLILLLAALPHAEASEKVEGSVAMESEAIDARLIESVKYLSSDALEGRGVGTEGIDQAADYLADEFREMGLRVDWFDGSAFQEFEMKARVELGPEAENHMQLIHAGEETSLTLGEDFTPMALGKSGDLDHELVFVGYGITAEQYEVDDYADVDTEGKVVVMLRREPQQGDEESVFDGKRSSSHATFRRKIANAVDHGAAGVIIVNDEFSLADERRQQLDRLKLNARRLANRHQAFEEIEDPEEKDWESYNRRVASLAKRIVDAAEQLESDTADELVRFDHGGSRSLGNIPVLFASRQVIDPLVQQALGKSLAELEAEIDGDLSSQSAPLEGCRIQGNVDIVSKKIMVKNVMAVLEGEGPLANETIVIGAHYDHLGMGGRGTFAPWTKEVHNGADDNASGTTALLEVARRFASRSTPPRRRMVFIAFTGEESGLLGSRHYVRSPRFPLDDTIAMINMDMVGRLTDNELTIYGTGSAEEFDALVEGLNDDYEFDLEKVESGYGPSDHASFYGADVPVLFFFTGLHRDYHRPSDDWEKINVEGMRRIVGLAVDVIDAIDAADARPTYAKTKRPRGMGNPNQAYLGIMPDMSGDAEGLRIQEVVADGPASAAGLEDGDVILMIGENEVTDFQSLGEALRKFKPEDKVPVKVQRSGAPVVLEVTLGSRG